MKANEIPEIIYISLIPSISEGYVYTTVNKDFPNAIEYVRTDAFIEKALAYLNEKFYFNNVFYGIVSTDFNAMEEMYEDFGNYMKGE